MSTCGCNQGLNMGNLKSKLMNLQVYVSWCFHPSFFSPSTSRHPGDSPGAPIHTVGHPVTRGWLAVNLSHKIAVFVKGFNRPLPGIGADSDSYKGIKHLPNEELWGDTVTWPIHSSTQQFTPKRYQPRSHHTLHEYPHSTGEVPAVLLRPLFLTSLPHGGSPSLRMLALTSSNYQKIHSNVFKCHFWKWGEKNSYGAEDPIQLFLLFLLEIMLLSFPSFCCLLSHVMGNLNTNLLVPGVGLSGLL